MKTMRGLYPILTILATLLISSCGESSVSHQDSLSSLSETTSVISDESSTLETSETTESSESITSMESSDSTPTLVETLIRTIDFEELDAGNMSVTAHNVYYEGLIEADGKISETKTAQIDGKTLGMRMPGGSSEDPRICKIQVADYTKIIIDLKLQSTRLLLKTNKGDIYQGAKADDILRDVEISTEGMMELIFTFYTENPLSGTMDCGFDNIRFYKMVEEGSTSSEDLSSEPSSSEMTSDEVSSEVTGSEPSPSYITMRNIADFLETKETHYHYSDEYVKVYQQTSGGYIDYAKQLGKTVDKSICEPNQKWHYFDSWLNRSIADGTLSWDDSAKTRSYSYLQSPELLLWIFEACAAPNEKIINAYNEAMSGKANGLATATIAKNMRAAVPWSDLEVNIQAFLDSR